MKKLINDPTKVVDEMIEGYVKAFPKQVKLLESNNRSLVAVQPTIDNKVGVVIGGGSGHEPAFMGYVGAGSADGVAIGNIFASPPPDPIVEVTKAVNKGAGVLYIYGNYAGDLMNFGMAAEMADLEYDIQVKSVIVADDVASAPKGQEDKRRGIAGEFFVTKVAGAAASKGYSLDQVYEVTQKANKNVASVGVGLSPCSLPQTGKPSFELGDDEMEVGLGHHGEPGVKKGKLDTADNVTASLLDILFADAEYNKGEEVAVLINGLGSTTKMELLIMFRKLEQILSSKGIVIYRSFIGDYSTSLEMGGCSITLFKLDQELKELVDAPADCPMFAQL